ncbi:MAG: oligopeptide transporter, OPT family [Muribaculaceae bacterium]|nr:oligopeptide transporter, OPT family [Muribaculaceae bacterium]
MNTDKLNQISPAEVDPVDLPENAFVELGKDEEYRPLMHPARDYAEATPYSVITGLILAVIFSAAAAYLGLKVGQVFEAAIPIAIIAVGLSGWLKKKNPLGQNVIIQSIGACSGVIVAGAIFTLPALYILQETHPDITVDFLEVFLSSLFGGVLGILFFIPFRRHFVKDMHGKYPFPEATATTQVLVSGNSSQSANGGSQAKLLVISALIGGIYDYIVATVGVWSEVVTTTAYSWGQTLADKFKVVFSCNTGAAVLGLGYIVGLKYAFVIFAGSAFVWWFVIPLMGAYGTAEIQSMSAASIFSTYARNIGIGGIAMAGIIGIVKSSGIIGQAVGLAARELRGGKSDESKIVRWQRDISMKHIVYMSAVALVGVLLFFWIGVIGTFWQAFVAWLVVTVIAFLFTTVAANAIAIVGSNPVSGMTLMTLIIASGIFVAIGLNGTSGIVASMVLGGVVCTALSMAGGFVTDLKIGYWLGSTPKKQESWKFLGTLVSAATVGAVMLMLNKVYGFGPGGLAAPQANAMAGVIEPMMMGGNTPWILYIVGAVLALLLNWLGVPALAFCLGMFLPLHLNTPMLVGGLVNWFVGRSSKDADVCRARNDRGTLVASGLIAGGALFGVFAAITVFFTGSVPENGDEFMPQILGLVAYAAIIGFLYFASCKGGKK